MIRRVYVDTNVFFHAYEGRPPLSAVARSIFEMADRGEIACVVSELIVSELLVKPIRDQDAELIEAYRDLLSSPPGFIACAVDQDILLGAAQHRAHYREAKLPDAIHVATAIKSGCAAFVSADGRLGERAGLEFLSLDASTPDRIRALS